MTSGEREKPNKVMIKTLNEMGIDYIKDVKKKYYTPEKEDFYYGYLYEHQCDEDKERWIQIISNGDVENELVKQPLLEGMIRTKFLDISDIESLGWKFQEIIKGSFRIEKYSISNTKIQGCDFDTWYTLQVDFRYKEPAIRIYTEFRGGMIYTESSTCIYNGKCKSINEFKKIIQWLEIN